MNAFSDTNDGLILNLISISILSHKVVGVYLGLVI